MNYNNILVVDDEKEIRDLLEINLRSEGYFVFKASSGKEALEILNKEEIHLIVLDVMMPDMNGLEVCKRIFDHIPTYEIDYFLDSKKYHGKYTFIIISNANRIAGINNFYDDVKLDDNYFEVMLCSLTRKRDILKAIYTLKTSNITKVSGIEIYKVREMKIIFKDNDKAWCVDGEEFLDNKNEYFIGLKYDVRMQIPKKNIGRLFLKQ